MGSFISKKFIAEMKEKDQGNDTLTLASESGDSRGWSKEHLV